MSTTLTSAEHAAQVAGWRAARDARLRRPDGWLALVGLHWLTPGENHFGAHPANQVVLHGAHVPPRAGSLWLADDGAVRLVPHPGVDLLHDGAPAAEMILADDRDGEPTILELGTLRFHLIRRGDRIGLRVRDATAPAIAAFTGVEHFPIDPSWRVVARFEPAPPGATLEIVDITGATFRDATPGTVAFEREGATWRLAALPGDEDGSLWLLFADATNGTDTYGGGRFLYSEVPAADGSVVVDFNLAYNPPCVFSPYATCPLPPPQNRLNLRIDAGELNYRARAGT
jgi:uncharacterized protein (DUF1684 family)